MDIGLLASRCLRRHEINEQPIHSCTQPTASSCLLFENQTGHGKYRWHRRVVNEWKMHNGKSNKAKKNGKQGWPGLAIQTSNARETKTWWKVAYSLRFSRKYNSTLTYFPKVGHWHRWNHKIVAPDKSPQCLQQSKAKVEDLMNTAWIHFGQINTRKYKLNTCYCHFKGSAVQEGCARSKGNQCKILLCKLSSIIPKRTCLVPQKNHINRCSHFIINSKCTLNRSKNVPHKLQWPLSWSIIVWI